MRDTANRQQIFHALETVRFSRETSRSPSPCTAPTPRQTLELLHRRPIQIDALAADASVARIKNRLPKNQRQAQAHANRSRLPAMACDQARTRSFHRSSTITATDATKIPSKIAMMRVNAPNKRLATRTAMADTYVRIRQIARMNDWLRTSHVDELLPDACGVSSYLVLLSTGICGSSAGSGAHHFASLRGVLGHLSE